MLTWGANVVAVKAVLADLPPILFAFTRFGAAFLVLLVVLRWREGSVGLPRRDVVPLMLLGLIGFGLYQDLWASALGMTTASNSSLITAATPVSTMLIAAAVGSDTLSRAKVVGAAIAFSGAAFVVLATHGIGFSGASAGDLMTFAATICWAVYVAFGSPVLRRHSPLRTATWAIGFGCLGMLPLAVWQAASFDASRVDGQTWLSSPTAPCWPRRPPTWSCSRRSRCSAPCERCSSSSWCRPSPSLWPPSSWAKR